MSEIHPTHIAVHQKSRMLEIHFSDDTQYSLPFEYLRVFSPSAEVRVAKQRGELIRGKQDVMITNVEPMGNYAVRLVFDDDHDSGIYSWSTLKKLAAEFESNWAAYRQQLARADAGEPASRSVRVLLFIGLAERLGTERLDVELPDDVQTVAQLIDLLKQKGALWQQTLEQQALKITVNKQFAAQGQQLFHGDEVALVPSA